MKNRVIVPDPSNLIVIHKTAAKPVVDPRNIARMDKNQKDLVMEGIDAGVDVSVYAKPEFGSDQMWEILHGLKKGIDVSPYADPKFDHDQMNRIREGIEAGIDVSQYAKTELNADQMYQIMVGLHDDIDVSMYAKPEFSSQQMEIIRRGLNWNKTHASMFNPGNPQRIDIDVEKYARPEISPTLMEVMFICESRRDMSDSLYDDWNNHPIMNESLMSQMNIEQKIAIMSGVQKGLDVSIYARPEFDAGQMIRIMGGLREGLDVSVYAKPHFNEKQMKQIMMGLQKNLDVSQYAKTFYTADTMEKMRKILLQEKIHPYITDMNPDQRAEVEKGIEAGIDISQYADPNFDHSQMKQIRMGLLKGLDVSVYAKPHVHVTLMMAALQAIENGVEPKSLEPYIDPRFSASQLELIGSGLKAGIDVSAYARPEFNWEQMREILIGMRDRPVVDVTPYLDPRFKAEQMKVIRYALESNEKGMEVDVDMIANPEYSRYLMEALYFLQTDIEGLQVDLNSFIEQWNNHPIFNDQFMSTTDWTKKKAIYEGLNAGVDITIYANPIIHNIESQMILNALKEGLDIVPYVYRNEWSLREIIKEMRREKAMRSLSDNTMTGDERLQEMGISRVLDIIAERADNAIRRIMGENSVRVVLPGEQGGGAVLYRPVRAGFAVNVRLAFPEAVGMVDNQVGMTAEEFNRKMDLMKDATEYDIKDLMRSKGGNLDERRSNDEQMLFTLPGHEEYVERMIQRNSEMEGTQSSANRKNTRKSGRSVMMPDHSNLINLPNIRRDGGNTGDSKK